MYLPGQPFGVWLINVNKRQFINHSMGQVVRQRGIVELNKVSTRQIPHESLFCINSVVPIIHSFEKTNVQT